MGDGEEDCEALVVDETRCEGREKKVVGQNLSAGKAGRCKVCGVLSFRGERLIDMQSYVLCKRAF